MGINGYFSCTFCGGTFATGLPHNCPTWMVPKPPLQAPSPFVRITLLPGATMPSYGTPDSICFDLSACEDTHIPNKLHCFVRTGLIIKPPDGYWLQIAVRSSMVKRGLILGNGIGIVDPDYCGPQDEIRVSLYNVKDWVDGVDIKRGERIAQGMFLPIPDRFTWQQVPHDNIPDTSRGGFGSTGR